MRVYRIDFKIQVYSYCVILLLNFVFNDLVFLFFYLIYMEIFGFISFRVELCCEFY